MKQAVLNLMRVTGAFAPFRLANRRKALILTYHRFSRNSSNATTSARAFARQLEYLTKRYRIVTLSHLVELLRSGEVLPPDIAVIAIDDGYRDCYDVAFPVLQQYNAPATLFAVTGFVDQTAWMWTDKLRFLATHTRQRRLEATINGRLVRGTLEGLASRLDVAGQVNSTLKALPEEDKEEAILEIASSLGVQLPDSPPAEYGAINWEQAREMDSAGVEIGSHTVTHPILTRVSDERLRFELNESRNRLHQMLGHGVDIFCYPNGDYDERVQMAARTAGYSAAVTIEAGLNGTSSDPMTLRRVHTENNFARFVQCTSGFDQIKNRLLYTRARMGGHAY